MISLGRLLAVAGLSSTKREEIRMTQWTYHITTHQLPPSQCKSKEVIECDQSGGCFVHDVCQGEGAEWLASFLQEKGKEGWELVQTEYHHRELLCIWKKKLTA